MKNPLLPLLMALAGGPLLCPADVVINEFLASNSTGLADEDGSRADWIELYNNGASAVTLTGYGLTDDAAQPLKWVFPAVSIPSGGYIVVFASGKNRVVPGQNLHTNFSLNAGGEYLALTAPNGTAIQEFAPTFPAQSGDISYGLLTPALGGELAYFNVPTPGAANDPSVALAETVQFSQPSKTFDTTFPITLSTPSGSATIRYTVNRALPIDVDGVAPSATVNATTDVWTAVGHGLRTGDPVTIHSASASYPVGMGNGILYFVKVLTADTFTLSADLDGIPVDVTSTGSGIHIRREAAQWTATAASNTITVTEHRFYDRDQVQLSTNGTLPAPFTAGTTYFVQWVDRNTIRLSLTPTGTAITMTNLGSGTHTVRRIPSPVYTTPLNIDYSQRLRARSFQAGRLPSPPVSRSFLKLDATAMAFTSNVPIMILHSFGSGLPNATAPAAGTPEDTKEDVWFVFEPKTEGANTIARLSNPPDLVAPGYYERRGSSTFGAAKFSMTMGAYDEFGKGGSVSPLGFASNDDFVLNAHFQFDRSLMHNDLIYRLSNEAGRWAPHTRHVEVFLSYANDTAASDAVPANGIINGATTGADYFGVYSFQDKISRGSGRLDIEKMQLTDNTAPNVQGGYVFKIDRLDAGDVGLGAAGRSFALVQPKEYSSYPGHVAVATTAQKTYLATTLNNMYSALQGPNFMSPTLGYAAHLDVPAAIDHWWLSTLPKSADAFRLSGYWHKSRFGKVVMGPIFDFDRAMGSTDGRDLNPLTWRGDVSDWGTDYFHNASIYTPNYYQYMFNDPNYWQATIDRYEELRKGVLSTAHVHAVIDEYTELLDPANGANTPAKRNFQKWTANPPRGAAGNTPGTDGTFRGETKWLKNWWGKAGAVTANGRFDFVDGQFVRPTVANVPSGPVAAGSTVSLSSPSQSTNGVKIYYTTDGTDPRAAATTTQPLYSSTLTILSTPLQEISSVRAIVPTSNATGGTAGGGFEEWHGADLNGNGNNADDFDDSTWFTNSAGTINGVGYDNSFASGAVDFQPYFKVRWNTSTYWGTTPAGITPPGVLPVSANNVMFNGTINGTAYAGNQTCFARWPFTLTASDMAYLAQPNTTVTLQVRYDDGFIAWINGTELTTARPNAPAAGATAPRYAYNAAATTTHADGDAVIYADFNITSFASSLHVGTNILAIQGLNSGLTSSDFVLQPRLVIGGSSIPQPAYTPSLTAGATEYTGPIAINAPTKIVARTLHPLLASDPPTQTIPPGGGTGAVPNGSSWSAPTTLYFFPGAVAASSTAVAITEVNYHPPSPTAAEIGAGYTNSNDFEFVRITNVGNSPVDLTGAYFSNGLNFTSGDGLQNWLPVGASVVVVENIAAFQSRYGTSFTILGQFSGELDDGGEHIVLNDKTGAVIADFIYGDDAPWPKSADGERSLLYTGTGSQSDAANWVASIDPGGSAVTSIATWKQRYFASGDIPNQGDLTDTDLDGLGNLLEYALGLDPRKSDYADRALGEIVPGSPAHFRLTRRRGASDLAFEFQVGNTPDQWTTPGAAPDSIVNNFDGTETVSWTIPASADRQFVRCRCTHL